MDVNQFRLEIQNYISRSGRCKPLKCNESIKNVGISSQTQNNINTKDGSSCGRGRYLTMLLHSRSEQIGKVKLNNKICSEDEEYHQNQSQDTYGKPLLIFDSTVVEPINTFSELPINIDLITNLKKEGKFSDLSQVQRWAIPAIRKQQNVVMIGAPKSGKTLAYLLSLIDYIQEPTYFEEIPKGNGPHVVIISPTSQTCEDIYYFCYKLLGSKTRTNIQMVYGGVEKQSQVHLTNGVDVLISTPFCLERLLEHSVVTNFERLTCLVLDKLDVLSDTPFRHTVRVILEKASTNQVVQKIFAGEKWSMKVQSLIEKYAKNHTLIITSFQDIAVYKKLVPKIIFVEKEKKFKYLMGVLNQKRQLGNIVVICENEKDATKLKSNFNICHHPAVLLCESYSREKLQEAVTSWKTSNPRPLLVITDDVLTESHLTNVNTIIHYDIPKKSKTNFFMRYSTYHNFTKISDQNHHYNDIIFIDDENHNQLPHILNFIKEMGGKIPENLEVKTKEIWEFHERNKEDRMLCGNVLAHGSCQNLKSCPDRHLFLDILDNPEGKFLNWVKFVVLKAQDAGTIYARIFESFDNKKKEKIPDYFSEINDKMKTFFEDENNWRPIAGITMSSICAIRREEAFYRAKVVEITKYDKHEHPVEVKVRLMDFGDVIQFKVLQLFELPGDIADFPPTAVEIRVAGIQPLDYDVTWSEISSHFVKELLLTTLESNEYWCGKVVVALKDVVVLEQVMLKRTCPKVGIDICEKSLLDEIIEAKLAEKNTNHAEKLRKLCAEANIVQSDSDNNKKPLQPKPQWAFFDSNLIKVKLTSAEGLHTVFLNSFKYQSLFEDLEKELQLEGEKMEKKSRKIQQFQKGIYVMAKFEGKWNRGRVEAEDDETYKIFFLDYGDYWLIPKKDVFPILDRLLLKLPLQAIECELIGLQKQSEWSEKAIRKLYELCDEGYSWINALVIKKDGKPECTDGRKYSVNLINEDGVSINEILIYDKYASENIQDVQYLKSIPSDLVEEVDEGVEDEKEDEEKCEEINEEIPGINLPDSMFDDEDGILFLQEFARKVFNISNFSGKEAEVKEEFKKEEVELQPNEKEKKFLKKKKRSKTKQKGGNLVVQDNINTPKIVWIQNNQEIHIRVEVADIQKYNLDCSSRNLLFRCYADGKIYAVDLRLFGVVLPSFTKITIKAFNSLIVLKKLVCLQWPRLHADEQRFWWISWDVSGGQEKDKVTCAIELAKEELKKGQVKKALREEMIMPCSDSDYTNSDFNYSDSE